jgi:hypothetical protein
MDKAEYFGGRPLGSHQSDQIVLSKLIGAWYERVKGKATDGIRLCPSAPLETFSQFSSIEDFGIYARQWLKTSEDKCQLLPHPSLPGRFESTRC